MKTKNTITKKSTRRNKKLKKIIQNTYRNMLLDIYNEYKDQIIRIQMHSELTFAFKLINYIFLPINNSDININPDNIIETINDFLFQPSIYVDDDNHDIYDITIQQLKQFGITDDILNNWLNTFINMRAIPEKAERYLQTNIYSND